MATVTTNLSSHHFSRTMESTDGSMDSNDISNHYSGRESPSIDNNSCCSDDTVLSVGNENPPISENLSFKNIESHLNAISQLTQNTLADAERHSSKSPNSPMSSHRLSPTSTKSISDSPTPSYMYKSDHMSDKSNPTSPLMDSSSFISPLFRPLTENPKICVSGPNSPEVRQHQKSPSEQFYFRQTSPIMKPNDNTNQEQNNGSLKFSIDNILKADFGRRITDPINIKKSKPKKIVTSASSASLKSFDVEVPATAATTKIPSTGAAGPVDLSKADSAENGSTSTLESTKGNSQPMLWPAWVYCTRYSDRPSSGRSPRSRRIKKSCPKGANSPSEEKRPRTAFSGAQLARLKHEFAENRYLTERRRQQLSAELGLNEAQIKIWFQNKRAKIKKASGQKNPLALQLMAQGLYNHSTVPLTREEEELQEMQNKSS